MSDNQLEHNEKNRITVKLEIPKNMKIKDLKLKHSKNSFTLTYDKVETFINDNIKTAREGRGYCTRMFPYDIGDVNAWLEDGNVVVNFLKISDE